MIWIWVFLFLAATRSFAGEIPIPVGLDSYRMWDRWPQQRIGVRASMRSTYDRQGGNEGADASHFLYQLRDDYNVTLDVAGPGVLYFVRYNHWHGSPWHYEVDGKDFLVSESSTDDPLHPKSNSVFLPSSAFPKPLAWTWADTKGSDLSWVPIEFEKSFRMGYSRTRYGTGYYIYHQIVPGTPISRPFVTWKPTDLPDTGVLDLINRAGSDFVPKPGTMGVNLESGLRTVPREGSVQLLKLTNGPETLRALEFTISKSQALAFSKVRLRITWDDRAEPSVDAPVALFFGAGLFYNRADKEYLVKSFPMSVRYEGETVHLACYFPMPFFRSALIELVGSGEREFQDVQWAIRRQPFRGPSNESAYFHATYRDHANPEPGHDLVLLNTAQTEGSTHWSGSFIGTSWIFSENANLSTLEGDPRFFFDDSQSPQAYGTGTEEWGGGGDYWGGENMTLPFAGHPIGVKNPAEAKTPEDKVESAYRFLLADLMPFGKNAIIRLEHGGENQSKEHYQTVSSWYGLPASSLIKTDELKIGDSNNEQSHHYKSPESTTPYRIVSRYEWGIDNWKGTEIYPAEEDWARRTTGTSEFTLRINPANRGVLLRRKLDYQFPNQRAQVFIADGDHPHSSWRNAGIWYTAGGNTCVYSNPRGELGATEHNAQTSNRRFREDEFLIGRTLTEGRSSIRVRVKFTPVQIPLFPGAPPPELAWTEMKYSVYCFVTPNF